MTPHNNPKVAGATGAAEIRLAQRALGGIYPYRPYGRYGAVGVKEAPAVREQKMGLPVLEKFVRTLWRRHGAALGLSGARAIPLNLC